MNDFSLITPSGWSNYQLLDSGDGEKLEQFGNYTLVRPDPQILWRQLQPKQAWLAADARFKRLHEDKGVWQKKKPDASFVRIGNSQNLEKGDYWFLWLDWKKEK